MSRKDFYGENVALAYMPPTGPVPVPQYGNQMPGIPRGLEYLTSTDKIIVEQHLSLTEVSNSSGQKIYAVVEDSSLWMRLCCGNQRRFLLRIFDNFNQEVLHISREFKCCSGCCWCAGCCTHCAHEVQVSTPSGEILGYVIQNGSCWKGHFSILNADKNPKFYIQAPCCIHNGPCCPCENDFRIQRIDSDTEVGKISKHYGGFIREAISNADKFSIDFPMSLDVKTKAVLMGALFLIDFIYFEQQKKKNSN